MPGMFDGKKGLITGVFNKQSIAWAIADRVMSEGAECGFTHMPDEKMKRRVVGCLEKLDTMPEFLEPCDVSRDEDLDRLMARWKEVHGDLDILVHSVAFAPREALHEPSLQTKRGDFQTALDISAYSLVGLCRAAWPLLNDGASVMAMTYLGSVAVVPNYNVMGVAKAALESSVRYLAYEMGGRDGEKSVRVNAISAGPIATMAAKGVGGIDGMLKHYPTKNCLGRNIDQDEVGRTALYLASDLASAVTGEVHYVDAGYRIVGW